MFNLFTTKTDSQKISEAKFDKQKYRVEILSNGQYSYSFDDGTGDFCKSSNCFNHIDHLIKQLEYNTKSDNRKKQERELERHAI